MEKGSIRNILNLIKTDKRYWLIFISFIFVLFFGQDISSSANPAPTCPYPDHGNNVNIYVLEKNQSSYIFKNIINTNAGEYYRINFSIKAEEEPLQSNQEYKKNKQAKVDLNLVSLMGDKQTIKQLEVPNDNKFHNYEIVFKAGSRASDLEVRRTDKLVLDKIEIDHHIEISKLNIKDDSELASLKPTVNEEMTSLAKTEIASPSVIYSFIKKNSVAGQIFRANGDSISLVTLKLHFLGNGGHGNYHLSLKSAEYKDGKYSVKENELAYFDFDSDTAENTYQIAPDQEMYQFPLSGKLEAGKYYFISIDNKNVKTTFMHNLQLFGTPDKGVYLDGSAIIVNKDIKEIGDLSFDIGGLKNNDELAIGGIQDLGGGEGLYRYSLDPIRAGFSEADHISGYDYKINYDPINKAVLVSSENDNALVYRFDTKHPFKRLSIQAEQVSGNYYGSILEYSTDGKEWKELANQEEVNLPDNFMAIMDGNGQDSLAYLKITYNKDDQNYKILKFFGLKSLEVNAEL